MKDELVAYKIAKLAKEKGFDAPTSNHYEESLTERVDEHDGTSGPFGWKKGELNCQSGYFINNWKDIDCSNKAWYQCSAPTQSLLQKWLREVKKMNVDVIDYRESNKPMKFFTSVNLYDENNNFIKEVYNTTDRNHKNGSNKKQLFFKTYEEALEKGLEKALKLIKTIKK